MTRIRVFLVATPRLLRDILAGAIDAQPDMELAVSHDDGDALARALEQTLTSAAAREDQNIVLLSVTNDGRRAVLYELRPYAVPPERMTPEALVDLIRATAARSN